MLAAPDEEQFPRKELTQKAIGSASDNPMKFLLSWQTKENPLTNADAHPQGPDLLDDVHIPGSLPTRLQSPSEELANSVSHGFGFVAALFAAPVLLLVASGTGNVGFFIGTIVFITTMLLLYLASTLYHAWPYTAGKRTLRVIDHSAIFLLIAGTYTPFTLGPLRGIWGATMFVLIWLLAIFGILMKITLGPSRLPKLAMSLYLGMGWSAILLIRPLVLALPASALFWLLAGGIAYTAGVLFFANERMRYGHFVWHLFALTGTGCHFLAVLSCAA